jgi:A/G-specific adenine glycosylase
MGPRLRGLDGVVVGMIRHVFTHFELRLSVVITHPATRPDTNGIWHPIATIADAGLPTLFARCANAVLRARVDAAQSPPLALETAA